MSIFSGQGGAGSKPMKAYGRPPYGQEPGVGMGAFRGAGVPQLARNQGKAYGGDGYNSYRPRPAGGGYGSAGLALGPHFGSKRMKGPMQGFGNIPNGYGTKPNRYEGPKGGVLSPQPGHGGAAGAGAFKGYGAKTNGYGAMPNGKGQSVKGAGVSSGMTLKGGVLSPQQQTAQLEGVAPQQMVSQGEVPAAPKPTRGMFVMVTQERYQQLPAPVPPGKNYKQKPFIPEATPEPAPAFPAARHLEPGPESALIGLQDKGQKGVTSGPASVVQQSPPGLEPTAVLPQAYGNIYGAGAQPDYASKDLGQGLSTADGKSGGTRQLPFNGAPVVPAGLDGKSQFEPQSAGLGPNGKLGNIYGGLGGPPFGGQTLGMGAEKSNTKYGVGGQQFGGQQFGGQSMSAGVSAPGNYGYGVNPYDPSGEGKSSGKYGYGSFPNGGQLVGNKGNTPGKYGGQEAPYGAQILGFGIKGVVPTPALAAEGEGMPVNRYVAAFPAAPSPSPNPSVPGEYFTPDELLGGVQDFPGSQSTASLLASAPATETLGEAQVPEQPDDPQQLPRQIHIQQHLKLHFHPQGAKNGQYDLNGFLGNRGYQG
ncbi:calymmin [Xenentodon cancila]